MKKVFLSIVIYTMFLEFVYSQQTGNIVWRFNDSIIFSAEVPEGWVAIENKNPQKALCYHFYIDDNNFKHPSIFIAFYLLKEDSDKALKEFADSIVNFENNIISEKEYSKKKDKCIVTYDTVFEGYSYSRCVFMRHKNCYFQFALTEFYKFPKNEILDVFNTLIDSMVFYQ